MNGQTLLLLFHTSQKLQTIGFTVLRISFGIIFMILGYGKLKSGASQLTKLGSAMGLFGITYKYLIWGYLAALTELIGGFAYVIGFGIRIASLPLIWLLIVALQFHRTKGDDFTKWAFACTCLCIVISYLISGGGKYSLDYYIDHNYRT